MGCTTEFNKWEGITFDADSMTLYNAISDVNKGMEDADTDHDRGTPNHIKLQENRCGCIMAINVDHAFSGTSAHMLVCGEVNTDPVTNGDDYCSTNNIANPDNIAMIPEYRQLMIGEDTGRHENNLLWIYELDIGGMTRVASVPLGAETTSPYWFTVGRWSYASLVAQHPSSQAAQVGYIGPIPSIRPAHVPTYHWGRFCLFGFLHKFVQALESHQT